MNEVFKLKEVIRYTRFDRDTALIILINDVLNLHLRVSSIDELDVIATPTSVTVTVDTKISTDIITDGGKYYTGSATVTFDKMNVSNVYPGGFIIEQWMGLDSILSRLSKNTNVHIDKADCELITTGNTRFIRFLESSLFWRGDLQIHLADNPIINESPVGPPQLYLNDLLNTIQLDGFEQPQKTLPELMAEKKLIGFEQPVVTLGDVLHRMKLEGFEQYQLQLIDYMQKNNLDGFEQPPQELVNYMQKTVLSGLVDTDKELGYYLYSTKLNGLT